MAKIRINGETFDFDGSKKPMSEALAIEAETGMRYADWETELQAGSAKAMSGFVWLVWRRNGRQIPFADILSGAVEIDLAELLDSLAEAALEVQEETDPTPGPESGQGGTPTTGTPTSASSPKSSATPRRRSTN